MQDILVEKPYKFIPPHRGTIMPTWIRDLKLLSIYLRKTEGVVASEVRNGQRLRDSMSAGHGVLLTPNHCRTADPLLMGAIARDTKCLLYAMASWHLYQNPWMRLSLQLIGAFSVNREGVDRPAINTAIEILETAERPLVIFPEGTTSRMNDRLLSLLDGVAFIARTAAKKREKKGTGKVVIHPVAIKYLFGGDLLAAVDPVLTEIEHRLTWQPQSHLSLRKRIGRIGMALLYLKEMEYFGETQRGSLEDRIQALVDRLLVPLEEEWLGGGQTGPVVPRVKNLRMRMMPEMINGEVNEDRRQRLRRQFVDIYLAQQVSCYPPDYLDERNSVDRILETVERFEEDITDQARIHGHLKAVIDIGEPIEVSSKRDKKAKADPLMVEIGERLQGMLDELAVESPLFEQEEDLS